MQPLPSSIPYLIGAFICVSLYAFFVCTSVVISRSRRSRLKELVAEGFFCSRYALLIAKRTRRYSLAAHVGIFISVLGIGFFAVALGGTALSQWLVSFFTDRPEIQRTVGTAVFLLLIPLAALILAQVLRAVSYRRSEEKLCYLSLPMVVAAAVFSPIRVVVTAIITKVLAFFSLKVPRERELVVSAEEINELIEASSEAGEIEEEERELIQGVFTFTDTLVREVMTPRTEMITVEISASLSEVVGTFAQHGLSRLIVIGENLDDVKGILLAKDLIQLVGQEVVEFDLAKYVRPAYFVQPGKGIAELLHDFRRRAQHIAIVQDEHGGVDGVVTIEDLVEEIVGEIFDEHDRPEDELEARTTQSGDLVVDGGILIDDLNEMLPEALPRGEYDTLSGFLMHQIGHIPRCGDEVRMGTLKLRVDLMDQTRVGSVTISLLRTPETGVGPSAP